MTKKLLNIALLGYGKMGKVIERIAIEKGHTIVCKIDTEADWQQQADGLAQADVAIEFSTPQAVLSNIKRCFECQLPVVVGTTGWFDGMDAVKALCKQHDAAMLWAANFSIGMQVFFKMSTYLTKLMQPFFHYKASIHEVHHTQKLDAPSGTAIAIANSVAQVNAALQPWQLVEQGEPLPKQGMPITYAREGNVFGEHYLNFTAHADTIGLHHKANNRDGFAEGAVVAAEFLYSKKGFYNFSELFDR